MTARDEPSLVGRVLAGVYRLDMELGRGAMGVVYRARHLMLGEEYAVKVLSEALAEDEHVRARFLQEARALTRLTHRSIVPMRHFGDESGLLFVVMGFAPGETLTQVIAREGRIPEPRAIAIVSQLLDALEEAHRLGVVHRDLKPDNVMVSQEQDAAGGVTDRVLVLDFGLARILGDTRPVLPESTLTLDGDLVGTVAYMSPEQVRAAKDVDGRSDLFSVGVILYEMVSGRRPFESESALSVMMRILETEPVPLHNVSVSGVSQRLQGVIVRALMKDVAQRFQSAAEFRSALATGVDARALRRAVPATRPWYWALAAAVVAVLAVAAWALLGEHTEPAMDHVRLAEVAAQGCEMRRVLDHLALAERERELTGEDRLLAAQARIALGDVTVERDLVEAARLLGEQDWRVHLARARRYWKIAGSQDTRKALDALALAIVQEGDGNEALLARVGLMLDPLYSQWLADAGVDALRIAANDLDTLAGRGAPQGPVLLARGALALRRVDPDLPLEERLQAIEAAVQDVRRGSDHTPRLARGPWLEARAWLQRASWFKHAGRYEEMARDLRHGLDALDEAVKRMDAYPHEECQAQDLRALIHARINHRLAAGDVAGAVADLPRVGGELTDVQAWSEVGEALRNAGEFEEAAQLYERLGAATQNPTTWFNLGYCRERLGLVLRQAGDRAGALESYRRSDEAFTRAQESAPQNPQYLAYRGEVRLRRSELDPEQAARWRALAGADFEAAAAIWPEVGDRLELDYRYTEYLCQVGRSRDALERMERIVEGTHGLNPSAYARAMQVALVRAAELAQAGQHGEADEVLRVARERAKVIQGLQSYAPGSAFLLAGDVMLVMALLADETQPGVGAPSAAQALELYSQAQRVLGGDEVAQMRVQLSLAEVELAQADPTGAAVRQRLSDLRAGHFRPTSALYGRLAAQLRTRPGGEAPAKVAEDLARRTAP